MSDAQSNNTKKKAYNRKLHWKVRNEGFRDLWIKRDWNYFFLASKKKKTV